MTSAAIAHCLDHKVIDHNLLQLATALRDWDALWKHTPVVVAAEQAAKRFGDQGDGVFSTACFQSVVREKIGWTPTGDIVAELLVKEPRVVRLSGGCHWMILPGGVNRYIDG